MEQPKLPDTRSARVTRLLLTMGIVGVLAYAGVYLMAVSPLIIRLLGPMLGSE